MAQDRDDLIYLTKLAEQAERYDEMVEFIKKVVAMNADLNVEERNLLSVAYKNVIGSRRAAWRILSSIEQKEEGKSESRKFGNVKEYRLRIEEEMSKIANEILSLLEDRLVPAASSTEPKVFFCKMKGDYFRYIAEFSSGQSRKDAAENALVAYKLASEAANNLPPTHPIRLGLALNFSVFYYEILNSPDRACKLAKTAFDEAIAELDTLSEESYKDSTLIMQLLRDNLTLWTSDMAQEGGAGADDQNKAQDVEAND